MTETPVQEAGLPPAAPYFSATDALWALVILALIALNLYISTKDTKQALLTEQTRHHASELIDRLNAQAKVRQPTFKIEGPCGVGSTWLKCRDSLMVSASGGPLFQNVLKPGAPVFAQACELATPQTLGAIVMEKGTPKVVDPTSLSYEPLADDQALDGALKLRVTVCGRLFSKMVMAELTF